MAELDIVLDAAKKHGVDEALVIYTSKIDVKDAIRYRAKFGEHHAALNWIEKGYDVLPEDMRKLLREYTKAVLIIGKDGKMAFDKFWKAIMDVEHALHINNYSRAFALMSGPCRGCKSCTVAEKGCLEPQMRRPSLEGVGVDILSTVKRFKKNITWTGRGFYSVAIVLLE